MNLWERMDRMVSYQPMFCDITWGAGGTTAGAFLILNSLFHWS